MRRLITVAIALALAGCDIFHGVRLTTASEDRRPLGMDGCVATGLQAAGFGLSRVGDTSWLASEATDQHPRIWFNVQADSSGRLEFYIGMLNHLLRCSRSHAVAARMRVAADAVTTACAAAGRPLRAAVITEDDCEPDGAGVH